MGRAVTRKLSDNPELRGYYETYLACRTVELVIYRKPTDKKGGEKVASVLWPTGFSILPNEGGWDDQPYLITRMFLAALHAERRGCSRMMQKS